MAKQTPQLSWCVVRPGKDMNWWVDEVSDPIHWDTDALSILDPRQIAHVLELCEPLREYGFDLDLLEDAFFTFRVDKEVADGKIRLVRFRDSLLSSEEKLFALPDILNEDKGPYAELLEELTKARVKLLNDTLDLEQPLTVEDLEAVLSDRASLDYTEGRSLHIFPELLSILEYVPEGFEDEMDEARPQPASAADSIPDLEEEDEKIEADETMRWGDEDDEEKDDDESDSDDDDDDEMDEDEDEERKPSKKPSPKPSKPSKGKKK